MESIGAGWRPLFGNHRDTGFSFEWHDFTTKEALDWARSFYPGSLELCLNLEGRGSVSDGERTVEILPDMFTFYCHGTPPLTATRRGGGRHRFITVEFARGFLEQQFGPHALNLHPLIRDLSLGNSAASAVVASERMTVTIHHLVEGLRNCPVFNPAREIWFRSKALEIAAHLFFRPADGELICTRAQRLARERVEKARLILKEQMQNPPLDELAKQVPCSPFYLSRQFPQVGGMTMQQYLRQVRMERAAELLASGRCNVTEAAMEVGYSSLSHFSGAFHETFGCCPGLYPLKTLSQRNTGAGP